VIFNRAIFILAFFLLLSACTAAPSARPQESAGARGAGIVGGTEVEDGSPESRFIVMIYGEGPDGESFVCTGTFISESAVLTAGHCVVEDLSKLSVYFGAKPFVNEARMLDLVSIALAPDYKKSPEERNDLAVIRFAGGLPKGARVAELSMPEKTPGAEDELLAIGYGRTDGVEDSEKASADVGVLRKVKIAAKKTQFDKKEFIVNQEDGQGACFGDSGGPLLRVPKNGASSYIIGVASAIMPGSPDQDACHATSVYMRTDFYREWIRQTLEKSGTH
jgi:secreted trypsin-like serine protease